MNASQLYKELGKILWIYSHHAKHHVMHIALGVNKPWMRINGKLIWSKVILVWTRICPKHSNHPQRRLLQPRRDLTYRER